MKSRLMRALAGLLACSLLVAMLVPALAATYPYQTTSGQNVKLRRSANTTSIVLANISAGDTVTILAKTGSFYKVEYAGFTGYAMVKYIDGADEAVPSATAAALAAVKKYPYDTTTTTRVKLRKTADPDSAIMVVIPENSMITVYDVTSNGFAKAKYNGRTGYVMTAYIVLAGIPTPTPTPVVTPNPNEEKYVTLKFGSKGSEVRALQEALTELGFYKGTIDSKYGTGTKNAVLAYQKKNELTEDGTAGGAVQLLLYEGKPKNSKGVRKTVKTVSPLAGATIKSGNTGEAVEKLQTRLTDLGYYSGKINGTCDRATVSALKAFQKKMNITADGIATSDVLSILYGTSAIISSATDTPTPTPTPTPTVAPPTDTVRSGDTGEDVKKVQQRLLELGYYTGTIDGKYGDGTVSAMKAFQKKNGLTQDGVCGTQTRAVLFAPSPIYANATPTPVPTATVNTNITVDVNTAVTIKAGSIGAEVLRLQTRLVELGYYTSRLDGVYLADDIEAVRDFQKANSLTVDGKAGYQTQLKLYSTDAVRGDITGTTSATTLRYGDQNDSVKTLQSRLIELAYLTGTADGNFGTATKTAVVAFQRANSLATDGVAGAKTQELLYSTSAKANKADATDGTSLKIGMVSNAVKDMQERLISLGYLTGTADGKFGVKTSLALISFQQKNSLTADGIAGAQTLAKLNSTSAVNATGSTTTTPTTPQIAPSISTAPSAANVRYANWYTEVKARCRLYPNATVYDFTTGISWQVNMFSLGAHADSEPLTAEDTANMNKAFGNKTVWTPKAVWVVFSDGRVYMGSTHNTPHGVQHIRTNNFAGHICIHFPRTAEQVASIGSYATSHQKAIDLGWTATLARSGS